LKWTARRHQPPFDFRADAFEFLVAAAVKIRLALCLFAKIKGAGFPQMGWDHTALAANKPQRIGGALNLCSPF